MKDYMYRDNIDKFPVAMAYVPWQHFNGICDNLEEGYCEGTKIGRASCRERV